MRAFGSIAAVMLTLVLGLSACSGSRAHPHHAAPTVTLLMASPPDSLDPAVGHNSQALEAEWLAYTPLLTYSHSNGIPGTRLIPGVATDLPQISDDGRTYTFYLRPGLVYSDGQPVRASDFTWAVERAIKLGWPGSRQYVAAHIVGGRAYAAGRTRAISGITTDDASGQITLRLVAPYGPFENVLALPAMAPVPRATPMRNEGATPPPGVGPYELASVVPGRSFWLVKNPKWRRMLIPGIPSGRVDTAVTITHEEASNALAVLHNSADVLDASDSIPPSLLAQISAQAGSRYEKVAANATDVIFMNVTRKPFSSRLARQAVQTALDDDVLKLIASGTLQEGCFLLPPSMYGHPHDQCPGGNIFAGGNVAAGRSLVERSGTEGARVTVWSQASPPVRQWMGYYASVLRQLGFKAVLRVIPDGRYYATLSRRRLHPQTGFGVFVAGVPNPVDFYQGLAAAPPATDDSNWGEIDDSYINQQVRTLAPVPASNLSAVSTFWQQVDRYLARQAYLVVFGYRTYPSLVSDRIDRRALVFSPVVGWDWSSFQLG